jgi:hypothetical protein
MAAGPDDKTGDYQARAAQLAPPDMLAWLHSPGQRAVNV